MVIQTEGLSKQYKGSFTYDDADWKPPDEEYAVDAAGQGNLMVKQRATHRPAMHQGRSEWLIHLNQDLPTELSLPPERGKPRQHR
jgi:hypothetical protein